MNNIFYEFLDKNNLNEVMDEFPLNENFNLPFVDKSALQPLRIDLVMYPIRVNNIMYNCYISSVPKPLLYFTLKKSKAVLDIATQEQILQALVSVTNKTLQSGKDYVIIKSPKTLAPIGKGFITGDAISWKKGVWQFIRMAIEKGSKTNIQSKVSINATSSNNSSANSNASSNNSTNATTPNSSENNSAESNKKSKKDMIELGKKLGQRESQKNELLNADNKVKLAKALENPIIQDFLKKIEMITKDKLPYDNSDRNLRDSVKKKVVIHPKITPETKKALDEIIKDYAKVQAALFKAGFTMKDKKIDFFMDLYKSSDQGKAKASQIDWFYENHVNNHFTMKRIFNS